MLSSSSVSIARGRNKCNMNYKKDVVVLHRGHPCINVYSLFGQLLFQLGCQVPRSELDGLGWDVCITEDDDIFVTDFQAHSLLVFQGDRTTCVRYGSKGREAGQFTRPEGVTINGELLLVCDQDNNRIQCFSLKELITNYWLVIYSPISTETFHLYQSLMCKLKYIMIQFIMNG